MVLKQFYENCVRIHALGIYLVLLCARGKDPDIPGCIVPGSCHEFVDSAGAMRGAGFEPANSCENGP